MHHLSLRSRRHPPISQGFAGCQTLVRFFALHRIKPHTPPLVRAPVNSFEFHTCVRTPQAEHLTRWLRHRGGRFPRHLVFIVYGQDYRGIIPFAPLAFVHERQLWPSRAPSPLVFFPISTHFTATPGIPSAPTTLKPCSFHCSNGVELHALTTDLQGRLRTLYAQ